MRTKYRVELTPEQRRELEEVVSKGHHAAYRIRHAHILLKCDQDGPRLSDAAVAEAVGCDPQTVQNVRKRFVLRGYETALGRKRPTRAPRERVLDGRGEAHLLALWQSQPPEGHDHWSLRLLAQRLVQLEVVETICYETVRRTLKKGGLARPAQSAGASRRSRMAPSWRRWKMSWTFTTGPMTRSSLCSAWMSNPFNS